MATKKELIAHCAKQERDLQTIGIFLKDRSRELSDTELHEFERMLRANSTLIEYLMSIVREKMRSDLSEAETENEMLWQAFSTSAKSHKPLEASIFVIISGKNQDNYYTSIEFQDHTTVVYTFTKEEFSKLKEKLQVRSQGPGSYRHGDFHFRMEAYIQTRILPDGTVLPDIQKRWERFFVEKPPLLP